MESTPRVIIDCRFAHLPVGIGRYTREIVSHLVRKDGAMRYVLIVLPEGEQWARSLSSCQTVVARAKHYSFREQWELPRLIRNAGGDLLFVPHFNAPLRCPVPFVVTVHDLILHRYPNGASPLRRIAYRFLFAQALRRASRIIAVSAFTAGELRSLYGEQVADKTAVVREGVAGAFHRRGEEEQEAVLKRYGIRKPFFLYVGNAKEHKNVPLLLDAFARLSPTPSSLVLVLAGPEAGRIRVREGVMVLPGVPDEHLPALYSAADAFVTATRYEGFGLPVAEAAACGCPVIAANAGAIPEAAPEGTVLLPHTVDAFTQAMRNPPAALPPRMLSWEAAAEETGRVLLDVIRSSFLAQ
ncbi:MAG: glycosyltransferase family 1 protein [Candidatus Peribacteraceae bacterium]|jgi:alpha-1,3-rhamnosyl/mannosyltransferase